MLFAICSVILSARDDLIDMIAIDRLLSPLVNECRRESNKAPFALLPHALHRAARVHGIADDHRLEEAAALLDEDHSVGMRTAISRTQRGHRCQ